MAPRVTAALLVLLLAACETAKVRPDLRAGEPLVVVVVPEKSPPPDKGLMLVNPLACLDPGGLHLSGVGAILAILCIPVLGVVDLVALPVLLAVRTEGKEAKDRHAPACGIADPAEQAAAVLVDGLVAGHGVVRAGPPGSDPPPDTARRLEVQTGKRVEGANEAVCDAARADVARVADTCARRWIDGLAESGPSGTARRG
jgi:hypothetical protein